MEVLWHFAENPSFATNIKGKVPSEKSAKDRQHVRLTSNQRKLTLFFHGMPDRDLTFIEQANVITFDESKVKLHKRNRSYSAQRNARLRYSFR